MIELNSEKERNIRNKGVPLAIVFKEDSYYIYNQKKSFKIRENLLNKEVLIELVKIIKLINITVL